MSDEAIRSALLQAKSHFGNRTITPAMLEAEIEMLGQAGRNRSIGHEVMEARHDWRTSTPYAEIGVQVRGIVEKHTPKPNSTIRVFESPSDLEEGYLFVDQDGDLSTLVDGELSRVKIEDRTWTIPYEASGEEYPLVGFPVEL